MSSMVKKERIHSIQVYRCILSYFVVLVHTGVDLTSPGHRWWGGIVEISMPLFFIISGYFLYTEKEEQLPALLQKRLAAMAKMTVSALCGYYVILWIANALQGDLANYWQSYCTPSVLVLLFVFNIPQICQPLWFMISMCYALVLFYFAAKYRKLRVLKKLIPLFLVINLVLSGELNQVLPVQFDGVYARYFLFFAVPFLLIGMLIRKHKTKLEALFSKPLTIGLCLLFTVLSAVEAEIIGTQALLIFEIPAAVCFFLLALQYPQFGRGTVWEQIGTRNSFHIYIMHRIIVLAYWKVEPWIPLPQLPTKVLASLGIFFFCVLLSECYIRIKGRVRRDEKS